MRIRHDIISPDECPCNGMPFDRFSYPVYQELDRTEKARIKRPIRLNLINLAQFTKGIYQVY